MDTRTAYLLNRINREFYEANARSFSDTRTHPWPGWERVAARFAEGGEVARLLDVACGNLRFECFCRKRLPQVLRFCCVDSCEALVGSCEGVMFRRLDIVEALLAERAGAAPLFGEGAYDAAVSFGFMHHVPGFSTRQRLVGELVSAVRPGGFVALSFWRFMEDGRLAAKAEEATARACARFGLSAGDAPAAGSGSFPAAGRGASHALEAGDRFLGWQDDGASFRYCHHFDDAELEALVQGIAERAVVVDRFAADGRSASLNAYLVLQRRR